MKTPKYYCVREAAEFPASEFSRTEKGSLVHHLGSKEYWHYAATGEPLSGRTYPGMLGIHIVEEPARPPEGE